MAHGSSTSDTCAEYGTPAPSGIRHRIESASAPALRAIAKLPFWAPLVGVVALLVIGGLVGGAVGTVIVALPVIFAAWLLYLAWPTLGLAERAMRTSIWVALVAVAVVIAFPRDIF
ncbi:hypothetical protein K0651_00445 [Ornithinimicrobium sp. Arc0846-15]|nr:hypothetical protein [Ornithinimicrobium laminariae]